MTFTVEFKSPTCDSWFVWDNYTSIVAAEIAMKFASTRYGKNRYEWRMRERA